MNRVRYRLLTILLGSICVLSYNKNSNAFEHNVFSLLERDNTQVQRLYKESTVKANLKEENKEDINKPLIEEKKTEEKPRIKRIHYTGREELEKAASEIDELMNETAVYNEANTEEEKNQRTEDCLKYCGQGYEYRHQGYKNEGRERICAKFTLDCGEGCTIGWNSRYLVDGTNYTCQEAIQEEEKFPFVGPENSRITLIEFLDFNCGYCKKLTPTIMDLVAKNKEDIKFIFMPVNFLDSAELVKASLAAAKQGKFMDIYKAFMNYNSVIDRPQLDKIIKSVGLDLTKTRNLMVSYEIRSLAEEIMVQAREKKVKGVPTLYLNNNQLTSQDKADIQAEINKILRK